MPRWFWDQGVLQTCCFHRNYTLFHAIFFRENKTCLLWDFSEKSELLKLKALSYKCGVSAELPWFAFLTTGFEYSVWALSQKRSKNVWHQIFPVAPFGITRGWKHSSRYSSSYFCRKSKPMYSFFLLLTCQCCVWKCVRDRTCPRRGKRDHEDVRDVSVMALAPEPSLLRSICTMQKGREGFILCLGARLWDKCVSGLQRNLACNVMLGGALNCHGRETRLKLLPANIILVVKIVISHYWVQFYIWK